MRDYKIGEWHDIKGLPDDGSIWLLWSIDEGYAVGGWRDGKIRDYRTNDVFSAQSFSRVPPAPWG